MKVTTPTLADAKQCRLRITIDQVGNYWTVLIFHALSNGSLRFMEIKRAIGTISQRSLTQALRDLEREGYVARKVYPTSPPKVEVPPDTVGTVVAESDEKLAALGWRALGRSARVAEKVR